MAKTAVLSGKKATTKKLHKAPNPRRDPANDRAVERPQKPPVDAYGEWLISHRGTVNPDLDLEF